MPARVGTQRTYFEFALWAISLGRPVSIKEVEGFFNIAHASAWRVHRHWMQANQAHRERLATTLQHPNKGAINGQ